MEAHNNFIQGLDKDSNIHAVQSNKLRDAVNISLFSEEDYGVVKVKAGTTEIEHIGKIRTSVKGYGTIDGKTVFGVIVFTAAGDIKFFNPEDNSIHVLYEGLTFGDEMDAVCYSDRNIHHVHWVDSINPIRRLEVNNQAEQPSERLLSLRPLNPIDILEFEKTEKGGQLFSGSVIIFYRYYNTENCTYSALSNPTPVIMLADESGGGRIGEPVDRKIHLKINTSLGAEGFDSLQLLIVKNFDGSKVSQTKGTLTEPRKEWFSGDILYTGEGKEFTVDLAGFMIDDLAIIGAGTINIENNRLVYGNFRLNGFEGAPEVLTAGIIEKEFDSYKDPDNATKYQGHWREETYAYGLCYTDDFGNSVVYP